MRRLFHGTSDLDTIQLLRDQHIDPPSKYDARVPLDLDDIVMTALQRDPDDRWQSASALRDALIDFTRDLGAGSTRLDLVEWLDRAFSQSLEIDVPVDELEHTTSVLTC